ncbi:hypothetical protein AXF42_Ash001527 [Apostasia shenzhenica]|uniref:DUF538 domain-containing protein n=1 Tax=Apostasia shenzhenica TaxID=1088818 RepID=A0A2I0AAH7_9ASPA|nr:hypothetical protein AXF42_Ash001527 [Apostasia shenzhenica]
MISSSWQLFIILLPAAVVAADVALTPSSPPANGTTVYEVLPKFGLPPGLLPNTVTSYTLAKNGAFEVDLAGPCYVDFEYLVYYEAKITGFIRYGEIGDLKGIQVRRFLLWFDVDTIKVDLPPTDYIYFDVGWITKKLKVKQFQTIHYCRKKGLADMIMEQAEGFL